MNEKTCAAGGDKRPEREAKTPGGAARGRRGNRAGGLRRWPAFHLDTAPWRGLRPLFRVHG